MSDLTTLEQIERRIGQAPDTASFTLTAGNREPVEDWLIAQGFDETRIRSAREDTIRKAYSVPNFRRALKHRGDYYPPAASRTTQETKADDDPGTSYDRGRTQEAVKISAAAPEIAVTPIDPADHALILASAIQALAGSGISEQRVIALIEKHVPAIVRQVLSEAMAAVAVNLDLE